ncbi:TPA: ZmpA/ZmpB/ZmpC family metallo-endopeptidase [Streptococcus suis]
MKRRKNRFHVVLVLFLFLGQIVLANGNVVWAEMNDSSSTTVTSPQETTETGGETSTTEASSTEESSSTSEEQVEVEEDTVPSLSQGETESTQNLPSHLLTILPLDADGDILRSSYHQGYNQVALIGKDGSVSKVAATAEYTYQPLNTNAQQQYEQIQSEFEAVTFEDLYEYLVPAYQSSIERLRIQTELQKTLGRTPTTAEVDTAVRTYYVDRLDLRSAFEEVKLQLPWLLTGILERTATVDTTQVLAQKKRILLGLTYLERQYSFEFEEISAKRLLLFYPEVFGTPARANPLDRIIAIGQVNYADLELLNAEKTFDKILSGYSQNRSLQGWIDSTVARFVPYYDAARWFSLTSQAYIVETDSYHAETRIYEKMRTDERLRKHLIALLNVSPDTIFAISTMSSVNYGLVQTYVSPGDSNGITPFKELLKTIAQQQEDFFATWARITGKTQELATANILVVDSLRHYGNQYQSARDLWSAATGPTANIGVKEFFTPLSLYRTYQQVGAEAAPTSRSFTNFMVKSLTQSGQETFTHEVTHIIDKSIYFNGQDRRTGQLAEVYARGLFESIDNSIGVSSYKPVFNLNMSYELGEQRTQNASSTRFQTAADLQTYMQGVMDVLYTLDYAEAQASLGKTAEEKALLYHQLTLVPDTNVTKRGENQVKDNIQPISSTQADQLTSLNQLIENGMVSSRFTFQGTTGTGTVEPNSYYVIQLFNPIYAAMQNDLGSVGELSFKRNAYELLAEYGYQNGMVAYISNQNGGSDQAALTAIFGNQYQGQMVEFKKAMFQRRIDKTEHLKAIDGINSFQELQTLMQAAVDKDLAQMKQNKETRRPQLEGVTAVENLKLRVYQGYLKLTNDFTESIYEPIMGTQTEESIVPIPIQRVEQTKDDLWEGETQEVLGQEGSKKIIKTWQTQDGVVIGQPTITETELTPMRPTIVYRGTKPVNGQIVISTVVPIPIETEYRADPTLDEGKTRTVEGKLGSKRVITTQPTYKGQPQGQISVREETITPMTKTIVYQGIKPIAKYRVTYQFVSQDAGHILPLEVMEQLPADSKLYAKAEPVTAQEPALTSITVSAGTWTFSGYQADKQIVGEEDISFVGQWTFTAKPQVINPLPNSLKPVYRLYHSGLKVHLYTTDTNELTVLKQRGDWRYEGISWKTETSKGDPVYRLYHPTIKVHLYTRDKNEYTVLAQRGWKQEGIAYRSYGPVPIYRLYHTGLKKHLYTRDTNERDILKTRGWIYEGIAWYSQP